MEDQQLDARMGNANSPAPIGLRLFAGLIDMVLLFFIHYGLYSLALITPIADAMNSYRSEMQMIQDDYKLSTGYGEIVYLESPEEQQSDYPNLILYQEEDGEKRYYVVKNVQFESATEKQAVYNEWLALVQKDEKYLDLSTYVHLHNFIITAVFVGGVVEAIWFFAIPAIRRNGQTPGMMVCGIRMISTKDYSKARWYQHLGRFFFIWIVESCIPYFFLANWTLAAVPAVLAILVIATPRKRTLHDLISAVMVVRKADYTDIVPDDAK